MSWAAVALGREFRRRVRHGSARAACRSDREGYRCGVSDVRVISESRLLPHPPEAIWAVLVSPAGHVEMDGSGTVRGVARGPERLELGSRFRMKMKVGLSYRVSSTVVEFEEHRLIAWAHFGGHRWRYELEPAADGTMVTESFDWSTAISPRFIERVGYPRRHEATLPATLERLERVVASRQA